MWDRSEVLHELNVSLEKKYPNLRWHLKEAEVDEDGCYRFSYNSVPKSSEYYMAGVPFKKFIFFVRRDGNGNLEVREVECG